MKDYAGSQIRNVAVLSHDGAGKTAVVENLLATTGAIEGVGTGADINMFSILSPKKSNAMSRFNWGSRPANGKVTS